MSLPLEKTNPIIMAVEWRKEMRNEETTGCAMSQTTDENNVPAKRKKPLNNSSQCHTSRIKTINP